MKFNLFAGLQEISDTLPKRSEAITLLQKKVHLIFPKPLSQIQKWLTNDRSAALGLMAKWLLQPEMSVSISHILKPIVPSIVDAATPGGQRKYTAKCR